VSKPPDHPIDVHTISLGVSQAYLLAAHTGLYLIDAGIPRQQGRIMRAMQSLQRDDLKLIFITHAHFDHYGSAAALREITGAEIAIHRADADAMARGDTLLGEPRSRGRIAAPFLPFAEFIVGAVATPADIVLDDGDSLQDWGLDAALLHTPGHTDGSSCLLVEGRLAFVGDLLSAGRRPHVQRFYAEDWDQIPASLARLQAAHPERLYAGHGRRALTASELHELIRAGARSNRLA
jgi:hydroxyacylglutathione hydrolase